MRTIDICEFIALNEDSTKKKEPNYRLLEITNAETEDQKPIYEILLDSLIISPDVFQFRDIEQNPSGEYFKSKDHITKLKKPLLNPNKELKPITIAWGKVKRKKWSWVVIDGHHRIEAYRKAGRNKIKAVVINGTPKELVLKSIKANNKDKLPMSSSDKLEAAWCMWVIMIGDKQRWATVAALGTSKGTMSNFGKVEKFCAKKLAESDWALPDKKTPEDWVGSKALQNELAKFTWKEARKSMVGDTQTKNFDEDALVRGWTERLFKALGHNGRRSPQSFGRAIECYMGESAFEAMIDFYTTIDDEEF